MNAQSECHFSYVLHFSEKFELIRHRNSSEIIKTMVLDGFLKDPIQGITKIYVLARCL